MNINKLKMLKKMLQKFRKIITSMIILMIVLNCGCTKFKPKNNQNNSINIESDISEQLISSARSIEKSLATLAASQETNNIPVLNTIPLITNEGGMGASADIEWTGPIEPLLEKICSMTNYNLKIMGNAPSIPIIVSITQEKAIIADILKNACLQAANRASIVVFPASKIVELRYRFGSNTALSQRGNNG